MRHFFAWGSKWANPFCSMVYDGAEEQEAVVGALSANSFIVQKDAERKDVRQSVNRILKRLSAEAVR
ncbi:MAG: hypothetical protein FJX83_01070 [Bacteroidetes bacterium]|nr:hypothetical protein [Bacteroidota bacterium]